MTFHIVRMDEKIEKIALSYQLDIDEIKANNKYIKDWNHLIPGTKLRLPEISNVLNDELDNYEPFIEEYYPKLSSNYDQNIKEIVKFIINSEVAKKRAKQVIASIEDRPEGILVYLSHGATLGESTSVQDAIKKCGLSIPEQMGNAVIYVTA